MRIVAFHLLNDFSGSPKVLSQVLKAWTEAGLEAHLFTSGGKEGFLTGLSQVHAHSFWYRWHRNPLIRLLTYTTSQILLFFQAFLFLKKTDVVYVNTVLPFGAALAGKFRGCRIVYHLHETTVNPPVLKFFLFGMVQWAASEVILVSEYMARTLNFKNKKIHILPNALESRLLERRILKEPIPASRNILMVCSLKWYKGIYEFVSMAYVLSFYQFRLVLNASEQEIEEAFQDHQIPENLTLVPTQKDVHPHYHWADLVLNLSRPDGWVETFGLTAIEAMAYGLPVIVPPEGGIAELVEDGENGFKIDSRKGSELITKAREILEDRNLYARMSASAQAKARQFYPKGFAAKSVGILIEEGG